MISTRDLSSLPEPKQLCRLMQSLAMLDAILMPEWHDRYYSFNSQWNKTSQMGSMRNGQGDDLFVHFSAVGCWIKGFAHESKMSPYRDNNTKRLWPGVLDAVPVEFTACLNEVAFTVDDATFCIWQRTSDEDWQVGPIDYPKDCDDPDGSNMLLSIYDSRLESYQDFAENYYDEEVDLSVIEHVYAHKPLTKKIIMQLNPDITLKELAEDIAEIGYPKPSK